ncbi:unnamed protein product, partial [Scytosiphon promiscuus]
RTGEKGRVGGKVNNFQHKPVAKDLGVETVSAAATATLHSPPAASVTSAATLWKNGGHSLSGAEPRWAQAWRPGHRGEQEDFQDGWQQAANDRGRYPRGFDRWAPRIRFEGLHELLQLPKNMAEAKAVRDTPLRAHQVQPARGPPAVLRGGPRVPDAGRPGPGSRDSNGTHRRPWWRRRSRRGGGQRR